jgi:uncharacterized membrane protein
MNFLKTTLIGGILFLIPISICVLILGKAHKVMVRLAAPLADWLPMDTVGGIAKANVLAVIAIVVVCFVAGLLSKSHLASRLVEWLESCFLQSIPGYTFIKGLTGGLTGDDEETHLAPVLARFDDAWQVAFQVERLSDGRVALFIPGAPDPWSGSLMIMSEERVQPLDRTMAAAVRNLRALGRGSSAFLSTATIDEKGRTFGQTQEIQS